MLTVPGRQSTGHDAVYVDQTDGRSSNVIGVAGGIADHAMRQAGIEHSAHADRPVVE